MEESISIPNSLVSEFFNCNVPIQSSQRGGEVKRNLLLYECLADSGQGICVLKRFGVNETGFFFELLHADCTMKIHLQSSTQGGRSTDFIMKKRGTCNCQGSEVRLKILKWKISMACSTKIEPSEDRSLEPGHCWGVSVFKIPGSSSSAGQLELTYARIDKSQEDDIKYDGKASYDFKLSLTASLKAANKLLISLGREPLNKVLISTVGDDSKAIGQSGGFSLTLAIVSLGLQQPMPSNAVFTGQIYVSGRVREIGGVMEKIAATKANSKHLYMPRENQTEVDSFERYVTNGIKIITVDSMQEITGKLFKLNHLVKP